MIDCEVAEGAPVQSLRLPVGMRLNAVDCYDTGVSQPVCGLLSIFSLSGQLSSDSVYERFRGWRCRRLTEHIRNGGIDNGIIALCSDYQLSLT